MTLADEHTNAILGDHNDSDVAANADDAAHDNDDADATGKPFHPPGSIGKKCPKPLWQAFTSAPPPLRAIPIWKQHISKRSFP